MAALVHPPIEDVSVEGILHAFADPVRVALFLELVCQEGPRNCTKLASVLDRPIPKSTLSVHMRILREAGLIRGERCGVEVHNSSRSAEVEARSPGLLFALINSHAIENSKGSTTARAGVSDAKIKRKSKKQVR